MCCRCHDFDCFAIFYLFVKTIFYFLYDLKKAFFTIAMLKYFVLSSVVGISINAKQMFFRISQRIFYDFLPLFTDGVVVASCVFTYIIGNRSTVLVVFKTRTV